MDVHSCGLCSGRARLFFKEHDATLLPALVSFQPLYKPLSMPVFAKKHGGDAAGAHAKHGAAAKVSDGCWCTGALVGMADARAKPSLLFSVWVAAG